LIELKKILISHCASGIYLRWYYNGWHYFNFTNGYEISLKTEHLGTQVTQFYSVISKIERPTKIKSDFSYKVTLTGISSGNTDAFNGLLMAEKVEQYEDTTWSEVDITRGNITLKDEGAPAYRLDFEITRKDLHGTSSNYQNTQHLYVNDTECDLDDDEIIAINKQVNDIAEMQDRQADFSAEFKIRKTRAMRALFELTGEVGANTDLPYTKLPCRYVNEGIEVVSSGYLIINKSDFNYYYVSIYSGNLNFFDLLEDKTLNDLSLQSCNHTWDAETAAGSHTSSPATDYLYPLCEPSDDGGMNTLTGNTTELYGGWIWPFVKCKAIFDEIISDAGFTADSDILTDATFLKMFMPITGREISPLFAAKYYYSLTNSNTYNFSDPLTVLPGGTTLLGDYEFRYFGFYLTRFAATYKVRITIVTSIYISDPDVYIRDESVSPEDHAMSLVASSTLGFAKSNIYEGEYSAASGVYLKFVTSPVLSYYYAIQIYDISQTKIGYLSTFNLTNSIANFLPDISQTDFIKMICNFFALIPDADSRTGVIKFWNYSELYENMPNARDWSAYLSESEDEIEFQFGEYAQNNYMRFNSSDDVADDAGLGNMQIADETLKSEKDMIDVPISTTDEVTILTDVNVSRITFNKYDDTDAVYDQEDEIDPRVVVAEVATGKTFKIRETVAAGATHDVTNPYKARAMTFGDVITNYSSLSRMLYKANLRRVKLNLPVYEAAGLKHYIPVYFSQFKAYFYVNKIENYVSGKLCTVEIIKL
jgi:hypothetical protein